MRATCNDCTAEFEIKAEEKGDEIGFTCPGCGKWYCAAKIDAHARQLLNERDAFVARAKGAKGMTKGHLLKRAVSKQEAYQKYMRGLNRGKS